MTRSQLEVAHLALDPAWIAAAATGDDALLQNFFQYAVMKLFAQPRGYGMQERELACVVRKYSRPVNVP